MGNHKRIDESKEDTKITTDVEGCSACGMNHRNMVFAPLPHGDKPEEWSSKFTHWGICPVTSKVVYLLKDKEEDEA